MRLQDIILSTEQAVKSLKVEIRRLEGQLDRSREELEEAQWILDTLNGRQRDKPPASIPDPAVLEPEIVVEPPKPKTESAKPEPKAGGKKLTEEALRDYAREHGRFTNREIGDLFGVTPDWSRMIAQKLIARGIIAPVGKPKSRHFYYQYLKPTASGPLPPKQPPIETEVAAKMPRNGGGHAPLMTAANKEIAIIVKALDKAPGFTVVRLGNDHFRARNEKTGKTTQFSSTPKHHGTIQAIRRDLRKKIGFSI